MKCTVSHRVRARVRICTLIVLLWVGRGAAVLADPVMLPGATHRYSFNDAGGLTAVDAVGGNNATLHNFAAGNSQWITGIYDGALKFTSTSTYAITDSAISFNQFSVSLWSRLNINPNSNAAVYLTPQGDNWIGVDQSRGVGIRNVFDVQQPLQGVWENYVIAVDRTAGTASVYRDGVLRASGAVSLPALNTQWVFGHNQDVTNTNGSFIGSLDEVQFYNRIVTPAEAAALASRPPQPGTAAHLVAPAQNFGLQPTGQYATASTTVFVNPSVTDWIAWNRFPDLRAVSDNRPGELFVGAYRPEVDDHFDLTITNPVGATMTVSLDRNGVVGAPIGQQAMIFGAAATAPDVVRGDNFGTGSFFNEAGAFNALFTIPGNYRFDFSFQNIGGDANYPDVYLLVHTVPEPATCSLAAVGSLVLAIAALRAGRRQCGLTEAPLRGLA